MRTRVAVTIPLVHLRHAQGRLDRPAMNRRARIARAVRRSLMALSLLLCVASAGLWVRSYFRLDLYTKGTATASDGMSHWTAMASLRGVISYSHAAQRPRSPHNGGYVVGTWFESRGYQGGPDLLFDLRPNGHHFLGFGYVQPAPFSSFGFKAAVPYWFIALLFAIAPAIDIYVRVRRHRRIAHDLCPNCGYDLRATPDRCPECGTEVGEKALTSKL